jgi:glycosyltransferase involved in cell wall biosynthesis
MIGTALEARSGIAAVVKVYMANGLFRRWRASFLATHADGSKLRKAWVAAIAWAGFMARLALGQVALLHVLAASDASFWRKALFVVPAHFLGVPYVMHIHCGRFVDFYGRCTPRAQRFIRWVFGHAEVVAALSEEWRGALAAIAPQSRIVVVPNPVDVPQWQAPLDRGRPTVLFLGMLKEAKGVYDLMRAWPEVLNAFPEARLVLAGSGELDKVHELACDLGIQNSVQTPGWVVGPDKELLMQQAWICALPSHAEALPMSILECMAAGIPVVASRVGGIPLAVDHGRTGLLVEAREPAELSRALIGLLRESSRRRAMGQAARQRATDTFSAEALVPIIEALWRAVAPQQEVQREAAKAAPQKLAARGG